MSSRRVVEPSSRSGPDPCLQLLLESVVCWMVFSRWIPVDSEIRRNVGNGQLHKKELGKIKKTGVFLGLQSILNISPDKKTCGPAKGPQNTSLPGELSWLKISLPATFHRISPPHMDMSQKLSSLQQEVISNNKIDHFCCYKKK